MLGTGGQYAATSLRSQIIALVPAAALTRPCPSPTPRPSSGAAFYLLGAVLTFWLPRPKEVAVAD